MEDILGEIMDKMKYCYLKEGEFLFKQGSKGSRYFILGFIGIGVKRF
jgi:hypothetical protein